MGPMWCFGQTSAYMSPLTSCTILLSQCQTPIRIRSVVSVAITMANLLMTSSCPLVAQLWKSEPLHLPGKWIPPRQRAQKIVQVQCAALAKRAGRPATCTKTNVAYCRYPLAPSVPATPLSSLRTSSTTACMICARQEGTKSSSVVQSIAMLPLVKRLASKSSPGGQRHFAVSFHRASLPGRGCLHSDCSHQQSMPYDQRGNTTVG